MAKNQYCNCAWEKDESYECGLVAIVQVAPHVDMVSTSHYVAPTLYCKKHLLSAIDAEEWSPCGAHILPKKKLPRYIHGPFPHDWRKVNLITRNDGTDLVRCQKCCREVVCHGLYRPGFQGCVIPDDVEE